MKLISKEEYDKLTPYEQGYATYMRAEYPGCYIPKVNPYEFDSQSYIEWNNGNTQAILDVQDGEE